MKLRHGVMLATLALSAGAWAADLQVADGVVVKFGPSAGIVVRDKLTVGKAVILTSQKDGQVGQTPQAGDWNGVRFEKSALLASSLDHFVLRYAGGGDQAALFLRGQSPQIVAGDISTNLLGLRLQEGAHPTVTDSRITGNVVGVSADAAAAGSAKATFANTDFSANRDYAINNATHTMSLMARGNWWGDASGPHHATANPQGTGSTVSDGIDFGSFLASVPQSPPALLHFASSDYVESAQVTLNVICTGSTEYRLAETTDFSGIAYAPLSGGAAAPSFTLSEGDGRKALHVQCRDSLGRVAAGELAGGVLLDTTGPVVQITTPAAGSVVSAPITIEVTATDPAGVDRVDFYLEGSKVGTDNAAPYQYSWDNAAQPDGQYDLRVVTVDKVGHESEATRAMTLTRVVLPPDTSGPAISGLAFNSVALSTSNLIKTDGQLSVSAQDPAGVARVEFWLDGNKIASDATPDAAGAYQGTLAIGTLANGEHQLVVKAFDTLNNVVEVTQTLQVAHDPPASPRITVPANSAVVSTATITVRGLAPLGTQVHLQLGGEDQTATAQTDAQGSFQLNQTLATGPNLITAVATDAYGSSVPSPATTVTLDASVPSAPSGLTAQVNAGKIHLSWTISGSTNIANYEIYRAPSAFTLASEAQRIARLPSSVSSYDDAPAADGRYYYRVLAVNAAGTTGPLSEAVNASLDSTAPYVVAIEYATTGSFDPATQIYGQGRVTAKLTVSEPLSAIPYLSISPPGGTPIPVDLVKRDETHYDGTFVLASGQGSGSAVVLFSGRDLGGIRGTDIRQGGSLEMDTVGPTLGTITVDPAAPIKVDSSRHVVADFSFDEGMASDRPPAMAYALSGVGRSPVTLTGLERLAADHWRASFDLPADAGANGVEILAFSVIASDALGNQSTRITAENQFQVYQNELPPLVAPLGVKATAQPAGVVKLEWQAVLGAGEYQVYRQAPGETALSPLTRTSTVQYADNTPVDGIYRYTLSAVRSANGQESLSPQSLVVEARSSRTAPGAPQNLVLSLVSQGVLASWQPPVGTAPAYYRLYRSAQASISSVDGLTPIKGAIKATQAIDAVPSNSEHAYVVTAVDAAGNESALSNSVYLNFSLLPVKALKITQSNANLPLLEWVPNGNGAIGYDVYTGPDNAKIKLTAAATTATSLTDTGYTGGERRYTVETIDANDVRMSRSILLPNTSLQIVSGLPIKRNVMNRLGIQVSNLSDAPLASAALRLTVGNHSVVSDSFALAGNGTMVVPVVVGGYSDLPAAATLSVELQDTPHEGETARVVRSFKADVIDSALTFGLEPEGFTSGATGKVRLTLDNTSDVEVEIVTARSFGNSASNEVRFKLLDADGNVISTSAYRQATGAGVVTLTNGTTVARIAPRQRYVSDPFEMVVPATTTDSARLQLQVDTLHYHTGEADEVAIPGTGTERAVTLAKTPYYGEVSSVDPVQSGGGRDITILGRALDRETSQPVPNTPLKLVLNQEGFERVMSITTGTDGNFRYVFKPSLTDSGLYKLSAIHPDMTDRPVQAQFTINRVVVSPATFNVTVPRNYTYRIDFRARTGAGAQAGNVRLAYLAANQPDGALTPGIKLALPAPINIGANQNLSMQVGFSGDNTAPPSGRVVLAVQRDDTPGEPPTLLTVNYTLTDANPVLSFAPNYIEAGLAQGQSAIESLTLENKGYAAMTDVQASLLDKQGSPAPDWISFASNPVLGTLGVGDKRNVDLNIAPPAQLAEGIYEFKVHVTGSNLPAQDINVFVSVTQSGQGNVLIKASDIYTATRDKNGNLIPGLAGARIFVQNQAVISQTYEGTTDAFGEALFQNLPAGTYRYKLSAPSHQEATGQFIVKPGLTINQPVFMEYTLISVEWSVREVTINDTYEITLNATYETDVPAPVVVMQPTSINLPKMAEGEVFQGELVLTNYGLVRADDVVTKMPVPDDYFKFEFLALPPTTLEAKQRVRLPYRVIALRDYAGTGSTTATGSTDTAATSETSGTNATTSGDTSATEANGNTLLGTTALETSAMPGCYTYTNLIQATCKYTCANGVESNNCGSGARWFYVENTACPVGSSPLGSTTGGSGSGSVGGGSGTTSGNPDYTDMPGLPVCAKGSADCYEPQSKQSGTGREGGQ